MSMHESARSPAKKSQEGREIPLVAESGGRPGERAGTRQLHQRVARARSAPGSRGSDPAAGARRPPGCCPAPGSACRRQGRPTEGRRSIRLWAPGRSRRSGTIRRQDRGGHTARSAIQASQGENYGAESLNHRDTMIVRLAQHQWELRGSAGHRLAPLAIARRAAMARCQSVQVPQKSLHPHAVELDMARLDCCVVLAADLNSPRSASPTQQRTDIADGVPSQQGHSRCLPTLRTACRKITQRKAGASRTTNQQLSLARGFSLIRLCHLSTYH